MYINLIIVSIYFIIFIQYKIQFELAKSINSTVIYQLDYIHIHLW